MEGTLRSRHRSPQVLRSFAPTRLQDDLLAAVYERLLNVSSAVGSGHERTWDPERVWVSTEQGQLVATGG
jgi:hypothetical protein